MSLFNCVEGIGGLQCTVQLLECNRLSYLSIQSGARDYDIQGKQGKTLDTVQVDHARPIQTNSD